MSMTPQTEAAAVPQTPLHADGSRLTGSQAILENEEDPRIPDDAPVALDNLPVEAQVRDADQRSSAGNGRATARELTATEMASAEHPGRERTGMK